jgi:hypothetical protein
VLDDDFTADLSPRSGKKAKQKAKVNKKGIVGNDDEDDDAVR